MADIELRTVVVAGMGIAGLAAGAPLLMGVLPQIAGIISMVAPVSAIAGIVTLFGAVKVYQKEL